MLGKGIGGESEDDEDGKDGQKIFQIRVKSYLECLMSNQFESQTDTDAASAERLSALTDGELDAHGTAAACADWRDDETARSNWHRYQLIGDVLRSDDLASTAAKDSAFLLALRARMANEPVVLAPEPFSVAISQPLTQPLTQPAGVGFGAGVKAASAAAASGTKRSFGWLTPAALAAGFVAVAGSLTVLWAPLKNAATPTEMAAASTPESARAVAVSAPTLEAVEPQVLVANGQLIRDARLDRYLAAHKQFAGAAMLGVPSAFVRSAAAEAPKP